MFGYCRPHVPALTVAEHSFYRGIYCGLCHTMSETTAVWSGLTLSYDFVFLALIRSVLAGEEVVMRRRACAAHPFRSEYVAEPNDVMRYCAAASAVLAYYNLLDDVRDGEGAKRALLPFFRTMYQKGRPLVPDEEIKGQLAKLSALEQRREPFCDEPAQAFGSLLGSVFCSGFEGEKKELAEKIGSMTGRWIYFADAVDDYDDDKKTGSYNPLLLAPVREGEDDAVRRTRLRGDGVAAMHLIAKELWEVLDRVDFGQRRMAQAIAENIVSVSMPQQAERMRLDLPRDGSDPGKKEIIPPQGGDIAKLIK